MGITNSFGHGLGSEIMLPVMLGSKFVTLEVSSTQIPDTETREFSFNFQLAPRNAKEAKTVLQIIRFFKQGMAPIRTEGNLFLKSPNIFELKYTHNGGEHNGLNKFKECALKQVNVDYTPEANYSTYKDGVMTSYSMDLSFQELEPIYNDDYGDNKGGVPEAIGF